MSYSKSRARIDFDNQADRLYNLSKRISYKSQKLDYDYKNLIYQSAVFLLSASIEEYLKNIIQDWIYELKSNNGLNCNLPASVRTLFIISNQVDPIKNYVFQKDDKKIMNSLHYQKPYYTIIDDEKNIPLFFTSDVILKGKKYPSVDNLKALFTRIGIPDILTRISRKGRRDFELVLKSFLNIRESIAHQAPPNLTFDDVSRNFNNIKLFIKLIDRELYSHIIHSSGRGFWPN